jgi:hypothetical protein
MTINGGSRVGAFERGVCSFLIDASGLMLVAIQTTNGGCADFAAVSDHAGDRLLLHLLPMPLKRSKRARQSHRKR